MKYRRVYDKTVAALKKLVMSRDGWRCRQCRSRNNLHVHHIVFRSAGGVDSPQNCITLCCDCHDAVHHKNRLFSLDIVQLGSGVVDANGSVQFVKTSKGHY